VQPDLSFYVDTKSIKNMLFLLSVYKPLNLLQVADVTSSRNSSTVCVGMEEHIRTLKSHDYTVTNMYTF